MNIPSNFSVCMVLATLAGCGGGGESGSGAAGTTGGAAGTPPVAAATAEGVYAGSLTGTVATAFEALVLENGDIWTIYGSNTGSTFLVYGFGQGSGLSANGRYTSADFRDFGVSPPAAGTVNASFDSTRKTLSGSLTGSSGTVQFNGGPISGSTYSYDAAPNVASLAGNWTLTTVQGEGLAVSVSSSGSFSFVGTSGCRGSGNFSPRASGRNVLNVTLTFGASPCLLPNRSATGIALVYPITATGQTQLLAAVVDGTRGFGTAVFGVK